MASNSKQLHKNLKQTHWVIEITQLLQPNNLESALQTPTSIFKIPISITKQNPQSYFPTHIALGPYNHFKNNIHKIQLYKLQNALNSQQSFQLPHLNHIVDELKQSQTKIRSCYDTFLEIGSEDLAWILLLDGLFLIQVLSIFHAKTTREELRREMHSASPFDLFPLFLEQKLISCLTDTNLMTEFSKDLIMVENQIPLMVLKNVLPENVFNNLDQLLFKFCNSVSPLRLPPHDIPVYMECSGYTNLSEMFEESHHLLHFLYVLIMDRRCSIDSAVGMAFGDCSFFVELLNVLGSVFQIGVLGQIGEVLGLVQSLFGSSSSSSSSTNDDGDCPSLIPSASQLKRVGVDLHGHCRDFHESIRFINEPTKVSLELPPMIINTYSEVVLRNLVAFEAATKRNPPRFSHYIALMSGLIVRSKDVKIMKEANMIARHSGSEEEVVKLFDGLRKALELHQQSWNGMNMAEIQMVRDINGYYESCWKVKLKRFIHRYANPIFKGIVVVIVFLVVVVVVVRTFCAWFGCSRALSMVFGGTKS